MKVTLQEDGIYGKAGDVVEIGTKKAIELGLIGSKTTIETIIEDTPSEVVDETIIEDTPSEVVVTTKVKKTK